MPCDKRKKQKKYILRLHTKKYNRRVAKSIVTKKKNGAASRTPNDREVKVGSWLGCEFC